MISIQAIVGCALVLSGLCVENLASRSWRGGVRADRLDARAALALGLPALGLALMAAPIAGAGRNPGDVSRRTAKRG